LTEHAFFYFRDPNYIDTVPTERKPDFVENPTSDEIEKYGRENALRRAEERKHKLKALKQRIRSSCCNVRENYRNPKELGALILSDFNDLINRLYPEDSIPDPLDREVIEHEFYAKSRLGVYIGSDVYFERLNTHVKTDGPPMVVLGESGSGKSALLANWAFKYRKKHPNEYIFMYFIGASTQSTNWVAMLHCIMGELKRRFAIEQNIPDRSDELRVAFANWLHIAAAHGRMTLIIDGLNQLEEREQAQDLVWLPSEIPANIRLMLSTLTGRPLDELEKRGWPSLRVEALNRNERKQLTRVYLSQYSKELTKEHENRIAETEQASKPLYLRALLEELRIYGDRDKLGKMIKKYLAAPTVEKLYEEILQRYEQDYETDAPGLVGEAMSLLWAARRGLTETELRELLGSQEEPLPASQWSPLYIAADRALVNRSGLIGFFHNYFREAVRRKYLPIPEDQHAAHIRLADHFESLSLGHRKVEELPWQLVQAKLWRRLYDLMANLQFFQTAFQTSEYDTMVYWTQLETNSPLRLVEAYRPLITNPFHYSDYSWNISRLLFKTGHPEEARLLLEYQVKYYRRIGNPHKLAGCLGNLSILLVTRGDLQSALAMVNQEVQICRKLKNKPRLAAALGNKANILLPLGEPGRAIELYEEQENICHELQDNYGLICALGGQAIVLKLRGALDEAMRLHKKEERICRQIGHKEGLQICLVNQANIFADRNNLNLALTMYKEAETICRDIGAKYYLTTCLTNKASILAKQGKLDIAIKACREEAQIHEELENKLDLAESLLRCAELEFKQNELLEAFSLYNKAEQILQELGKKRELAVLYTNKSRIVGAMWGKDAAIAELRRSETAYKELGDKRALLDILAEKSQILFSKGNYNEAMELYREEQRISKKLGYKEGLVTSLASQAILLSRQGNRRNARRVAKKALRIATLNGLSELAAQIRLLFDSLEVKS
jgi:tetratricopeptide (TPR) repeat protein